MKHSFVTKHQKRTDLNLIKNLTIEKSATLEVIDWALLWESEAIQILP